MACTVDIFRTRLPEFDDETDYPNARIQLFLDDAVLYIGADENRWCNKYDLAHCYLAAHLLRSGTLSEAGDASANAGSISSKSAGGVSVSKTAVAKSRSDQDDFYMATMYGQQFVIIRNTCLTHVLIANQL